MNIEFSREQELLINDIAKSNNTDSNAFMKEAILRAIDIEIKRNSIGQEIDAFVIDTKRKIKPNIRIFLYKLSRPFKSLYFSLPFLFYIVFFIAFFNIIEKPETVNNDFMLASALLLLFFSILSLVISILGLNFSYYLYSDSRKKTSSRQSRLGKEFGNSYTRDFAIKIHSKYYLDEIKNAITELEENILHLESVEKKISAGAFIIAISFSILIQYNFGSELSKITDDFSILYAGMSFVVFGTFTIQFLITLSYFNSLIYYKKALTGLKEAQNLNLKTFSFGIPPEQRELIDTAASVCGKTQTSFILDSVCQASENALSERSIFVLNDEQWSEFNRALDVSPQSNKKLADMLQQKAPWES